MELLYLVYNYLHGNRYCSGKYILTRDYYMYRVDRDLVNNGLWLVRQHKSYIILREKKQIALYKRLSVYTFVKKPSRNHPVAEVKSKTVLLKFKSKTFGILILKNTAYPR